MKVKVGLLTLGCRVNQSETFFLERQLKSEGYEICSYREVSDIYVINTCSVTSRADQKAREYIRFVLKNNSKAEVIVTGCYAQRDETIIKSISERIVVLNNWQKKGVIDYIKNNYNAVMPCRQETVTENNRHERTRVFLKIQDGCKKFCKYCIVPYVRQEFYSMPVEEVIREARRLTGCGYREIVICGINFSYYREMTKLLEKLQEVDRLERIRLSSIEPADVSSDIISLIRNSSKICRHLHIPLQSGSDNVLKLMGRGYNTDKYMKLIDNIRKNIMDISITTDVIAGLPGETEADFEATCRFIKDIGFSKIHIFRYSSRPGTEASTMAGVVPEPVKKQRSEILLNIERRERKKFWSRYLKRTLDVLVEKEEVSAGLGNSFTGFTDNYIKVIVKGKAEVNSIVPVRLTALREACVIGERIN